MLYRPITSNTKFGMKSMIEESIIIEIIYDVISSYSCLFTLLVLHAYLHVL